MLERLIGEDIELICTPGVGTGRVRADVGQLEQVLINLAINARDAMPDGGRLVIQTSNAFVDKSDLGNHPEAVPGDYVLIAIGDNGCGMAKEVLDHIFEPFFTTKDKGKGTGLGMSMVYGIIKQNNGFITVNSEVGTGSIFRVFLPLVLTDVAAIEKPAVSEFPIGSETILLVEDEDMVRNLAKKILARQGYRLIIAGNGGDAYLQSENFSGRIHLLLTDVIMPNMNGKQLFERLLPRRPDLKVLYMSGYTEDAIASQGVLDEGTQFLQKPFTIETLSRKVRAVLDT
jgi:two-component system, cell cycle sensor histidine kinase and response regulator CckA